MAKLNQLQKHLVVLVVAMFVSCIRLVWGRAPMGGQNLSTSNGETAEAISNGLLFRFSGSTPGQTRAIEVIPAFPYVRVLTMTAESASVPIAEASALSGLDPLIKPLTTKLDFFFQSCGDGDGDDGDGDDGDGDGDGDGGDGDDGDGDDGDGGDGYE